MRVLRLASRGLSLAVRFHEEGETQCAFDSLKHGTESLVNEARDLALSKRATIELALERVEGELALLYDGHTADRLMQTLRLGFNGRSMRDVAQACDRAGERERTGR